MLTTLATLNEIKKIATADEKRAIMCLAAATEWLEYRIGHRVQFQDELTETVNGTGCRLLYTTHWPIVTVTSITQNGSTSWTIQDQSDTPSPGTYDCFLPFHERLSGGTKAAHWIEGFSDFPEGVGNFQIVYDCGYKVVPEDLQYATALVAHMFINEEHGVGTGGKRIGDVDVSLIIRNPLATGSQSDYQIVRACIERYGNR